MYSSAEGIVFRQVKAAGGRRMILLFTKKYGKISAGSSISEKGKKRSALALRPFTCGVYELYKNGEYYNIDSAEVKRSFFRIGEDLEKYMQASFVLELTEKALPEGLPQPRLFHLLTEFLSAMEKREKSHETLVLAYEVKLLDILGCFPQLSACTRCGSSEDLCRFSIADGGMLCNRCGNKTNDALIYQVKFDIVNILKFFRKTPVHSFEKIALDREAAGELQQILRKYISYHLDIGALKSESIFEENF